MDMQEAVKPGKKSRILVYILLPLTIIMFLAVVLITIGKIANPDDSTIFGYKPIIIQSGSMEPTINTNALVIGKKVDFKDLQIGDIITYEMADGELNTHRIISAVAGFDLFYTKGDNLLNPDTLDITPENYKYKIVNVFNWVSELGTAQGILMYIILPIFGFVGFIVIVVFTVRFIRKMLSRARVRETKESVSAKPLVKPQMETQKSRKIFKNEKIKENSPPVIDWREALFMDIDLDDTKSDSTDISLEEKIYQPIITASEKPVISETQKSQETVGLSELDWRDELFKDIDLDFSEADFSEDIFSQKKESETAENIAVIKEELPSANIDIQPSSVWKKEVTDTRKANEFIPKFTVLKPSEKVDSGIKNTAEERKRIALAEDETYIGWREETEEERAQQQELEAAVPQEPMLKQALGQVYREVLNDNNNVKVEPSAVAAVSEESDWRDELLSEFDISDIDI